MRLFLPTKCPFLPGIPRNQLISTDEMCGKIEAAVEAKTDPDFVIARTDVIGTVSREEYYRDSLIEEVVKRSKAYAEAGADAIFVMALTKEDLNYFAREIKAPLVGIFATAEPLPISDFQEAGCQITIGSLVGIYAAARGLVDALRRLKETENWNAITNLMVDDREFFEILDLNQYLPGYSKYRIP